MMSGNCGIEQVYDLVVVGSGPGGMSAALNADRYGASCLIVDRFDSVGGQFLNVTPAKENAFPWGNAKINEIRNLLNHVERSEISVWTGSQIYRCSSGGLIYISKDNTIIPLKYRKLVIATGAREYVIPFQGWTLPGVMTLGAAQRMAVKDGIHPGSKVLISGNSPLLLSGAHTLLESGVEVIAIAVATTLNYLLRHGWPLLFSQKALQYMRDMLSILVKHRVPIYFGHGVSRSLGEKEVTGAEIAPYNHSYLFDFSKSKEFEVDTICVSHGLIPNTRLCQMLNCDAEYHHDTGVFFPNSDQFMRTSNPDVYIVGEVAGIGGAEKATVEGRIAGLDVVRSLGYLQEGNFQTSVAPLLKKRKKLLGEAEKTFKAFVPPGLLTNSISPGTIICRCEEVKYNQLENAITEHNGKLRTIKMRTRIGMGMCQGRGCEKSVRHAISSKLNKPAEDISILKTRPPLEPVPLHNFRSFKSTKEKAEQ